MGTIINILAGVGVCTLASIVESIRIKHRVTELPTIEECSHDEAYIRIISIAATCETTQLVCPTCEKELEPPQTTCL